jgi:Na+/H+ antiporter NhaD/arsenite permease-like protein
VAHADARFFPFILMLFALFVVAGGIKVSGNLLGTPATNTALIAFGTLSANLFGTIGASLLLIRPVLKANKDRHTRCTSSFSLFSWSATSEAL